MANEIDEFSVEVALHTNLKKFVSDKLVVYNENALVVMRRILDKHPNGCFDMIFADPPYYDPQFPTIEKLSKRLRSGGILILSQPKEIENFKAENLILISEKLYSGAKILFFRAK